MREWIAVSYGALDVSGLKSFPGVELLVTPTHAGTPLALFGDGALFWSRLVTDGPLDDASLSDHEREIVQDMEAMGIATTDAESTSCVREIPAPWFSSPMHELVCALIASVARDGGIECVFIKGPVLNSQGLREREHSGDVDVWVRPSQIEAFIDRMAPWGWRVQADIWLGTTINHSTTLEPNGWGCEIDVHRRLPGFALSDADAFDVLIEQTVAVSFSSVAARAPSREANAVLMGLHALRPEVGQVTPQRAIDVAWHALEAGGEQAADFAVRIGAVGALSDALTQVFPDRRFPRAQEPFDWRWRGQPTKVSAYLMAVRMLPLSKRPAVLWRIFWPSREVVLQSERHVAGDVVGMIRARAHRLWRALRELHGRRPPASW